MTDVEALYTLFALVIAFWFYAVLPMGMAHRRGRSRFGWLMVSLVLSPVIAIVGLMLVGRAK